MSMMNFLNHISFSTEYRGVILIRKFTQDQSWVREVFPRPHAGHQHSPLWQLEGYKIRLFMSMNTHDWTPVDTLAT